MISSIEDLDQIEARLTELNMKLYAITTLDTCEKLSIYDDILYIDDKYYDIFRWIQPIWRTLTSQGREHIYVFLDKYLNEYLDLLKRLNEWTSIYGGENKRKRELKQSSSLFVSKLVTGLENVSDCYNDYDELKTVISTFDTNKSGLIY